MLKDKNSVRRIISEDIVIMDGFNYINNSTELLDYLWKGYDIAKGDGANFVQCMTYLNEIQKIAWQMIQSSGLDEDLSMNHILPVYTQMLDRMANESMPNEYDLEKIPKEIPDYEMCRLFLSRLPELLASIDSVSENILSVILEADDDKYIPVFIPYLNAYASYLNNVRNDLSKSENIFF